MKVGWGGEVSLGSGMTVYVGSYDDMVQIAHDIDQKFGAVLPEARAHLKNGDVRIVGNVAARFDAQADGFKFTTNGVPVREDRLYVSPSGVPDEGKYWGVYDKERQQYYKVSTKYEDAVKGKTTGPERERLLQENLEKAVEKYGEYLMGKDAHAAYAEAKAAGKPFSERPLPPHMDDFRKADFEATRTRVLEPVRPAMVQADSVAPVKPIPIVADPQPAKPALAAAIQATPVKVQPAVAASATPPVTPQAAQPVKPVAAPPPPPPPPPPTPKSASVPSVSPREEAVAMMSKAMYGQENVENDQVAQQKSFATDVVRRLEKAGHTIDLDGKSPHQYFKDAGVDFNDPKDAKLRQLVAMVGTDERSMPNAPDLKSGVVKEIVKRAADTSPATSAPSVTPPPPPPPPSPRTPGADRLGGGPRGYTGGMDLDGTPMDMDLEFRRSSRSQTPAPQPTPQPEVAAPSAPSQNAPEAPVARPTQVETTAPTASSVTRPQIDTPSQTPHVNGSLAKGQAITGVLTGGNRMREGIENGSNGEIVMGGVELVGAGADIAASFKNVKGAGAVGVGVTALDGVYQVATGYESKKSVAENALKMGDKSVEVTAVAVSNVYSVGMAGNAGAVLYDRLKEQEVEKAQMRLKIGEMLTGGRSVNATELAQDFANMKLKDAHANLEAVRQSTPGQVVENSYKIIEASIETAKVYSAEAKRFDSAFNSETVTTIRSRVSADMVDLMKSRGAVEMDELLAYKGQFFVLAAPNQDGRRDIREMVKMDFRNPDNMKLLQEAVDLGIARNEKIYNETGTYAWWGEKLQAHKNAAEEIAILKSAKTELVPLQAKAEQLAQLMDDLKANQAKMESSQRADEVAKASPQPASQVFREVMAAPRQLNESTRVEQPSSQQNSAPPRDIMAAPRQTTQLETDGRIAADLLGGLRERGVVSYEEKAAATTSQVVKNNVAKSESQGIS